MTLERLGESDAMGSSMLAALAAHGWTIDERAAFAGGGVLVTVSKNGHEVRVARRSLAEAALDAFIEAARVQAIGEPIQLELV